MNIDSFDAVYYPQQVPKPASLSLLAFVFDRLYFPGVYLPTVEFDEEAVRREIQRILSLRANLTVDDVQMLNCMEFACHLKHLRDFCIFTGSEGQMGGLEEGAGELMMVIEEMIFGPPPPGFIPTPSLGFCKGLEDDVRVQINAPSSIAYPANALVFSSTHGLPLINDDPRLPVPAIPSAPKSNATALATLLTLESVRLALPRLKQLTPQQVAELRLETRDLVKPFRLKMLELSKELNAAISSDMSLAEVQKEAQFLVETTIYRDLEDLKRAMEDPGKPWYKRVVDLAKDVPELSTNFLTMPTGFALARVFARISVALAELRDEQRDKDGKLSKIPASITC